MYYLIFLAFDIQKLEIFLPHVDLTVWKNFTDINYYIFNQHISHLLIINQESI